MDSQHVIRIYPEKGNLPLEFFESRIQCGLRGNLIESNLDDWEQFIDIGDEPNITDRKEALAELRQRVRRLVREHLPDRQRRATHLRFYYKNKRRTLKDTGKVMGGIKHQAVNNLINSALSNIQKGLTTDPMLSELLKRCGFVSSV